MTMNLNAVNVVMFGTGAILIYCAIKDKNPKDVVVNAFSGSVAKSSSKDPASASSGPQTADGSGPAPSGNDAPQFQQPFTTRPVVTSN